MYSLVPNALWHIRLPPVEIETSFAAVGFGLYIFFRKRWDRPFHLTWLSG